MGTEITYKCDGCGKFGAWGDVCCWKRVEVTALGGGYSRTYIHRDYCDDCYQKNVQVK